MRYRVYGDWRMSPAHLRPTLGTGRPPDVLGPPDTRGSCPGRGALPGTRGNRIDFSRIFKFNVEGRREEKEKSVEGREAQTLKEWQEA